MKLAGRIAFSAMLGACVPASAVELSEKSKTFTVRGSSLTVLKQDLSMNGKPSTSNRPNSKSTAMFEMKPTVRIVSSASGCRIADANVRLRITYVRPSLSSVGRIDPTIRKIFNVVSSDILAFQNEQKRIAIAHAQNIEKTLPKLRVQRTCKAAENAVTTEFFRRFEIHDIAQKKLTERWGRGLNAKLVRAIRNAL